jgi:hypothetical protein
MTADISYWQQEHDFDKHRGLGLEVIGLWNRALDNNEIQAISRMSKEDIAKSMSETQPIKIESEE